MHEISVKYYILQMRLREVNCLAQDYKASQQQTQGLLMAVFAPKTLLCLFSEVDYMWGFVCGFLGWRLPNWSPCLSHRASLGTLTMPWGPSSTTTLYGSSLGDSRNSTTFLRDTQWRSERATHFGQVSSICGPWQGLVPHTLILYKLLQGYFFPSDPVALGGFPTRNHSPPYFQV